MALCKRCWREIDNNAKFCENCGAPAQRVIYKVDIKKIVIKAVVATLFVGVVAFGGWKVFFDGMKTGHSVSRWNENAESIQYAFDTEEGREMAGVIKRNPGKSGAGKNVFTLYEIMPATEDIRAEIEPVSAILTIKTDLFGTVESVEMEIPQVFATSLTKEDIVRLTANVAYIMDNKGDYDLIYDILSQGSGGEKWEYAIEGLVIDADKIRQGVGYNVEIKYDDKKSTSYGEYS